jgi:hypothetical protein
VRELEEQQRPALQSFLDRRPEATLFQSPAWADVVRAAYGHRVRCWVATRGAEIVGVFSVTVMRVPGLGCKYVASPYQMHSGVPIAADDDAAAALLSAAIGAAQADDAKYFEIRHFNESALLTAHGFVASPSGLVTTMIPLTGLTLTQAEHGHRQRVRKSEKLGVEVVRSGTIEDLQQFRRLYLETGRAMGAPQAGWPYFAATREHLFEKLRLYLARRDGRFIGGFLVLGDRHLTFARCSAHSSREALEANAGHALWWRAMQDAAAEGCPGFHCGVSSEADAGLVKWKAGWGGVSRPVHVFVLAIRSKAPRAGAYFDGYGWAKAAWKRLPIRMVDILGHQVTRWVG